MSLNTFPLDLVILAAMVSLVLPGAASSHYLSYPGPRQINLGFGCLPCSLLERMKHVDALRQLGDVEHPVRESRVNAQLTSTRANGRHRFPVGRVKPILYQA